MLTTNRLTLRNFTDSAADLAAIYQLMSDQEINQYLPWFPLENLDQARSFYQEHILSEYLAGGYFFAIVYQNQIVGYVDVSADASHDFGYGLLKAFWNQGIVTEASVAVINYLKTTNLEFITATHDKNNPASGRVMQKLGMKYQYSYEEHWLPKDLMVTFRMYQLNFTPGDDQVYREYWQKFTKHFVENFNYWLRLHELAI